MTLEDLIMPMRVHKYWKMISRNSPKVRTGKWLLKILDPKSEAPNVRSFEMFQSMPEMAFYMIYSNELNKTVIVHAIRSTDVWNFAEGKLQI